jgi:tagatose-1,6-bisphosphate aldolase non-catalytic subunit AgaZ/GatZ
MAYRSNRKKQTMPTIEAYRSGIFTKYKVTDRQLKKAKDELLAEGYVIIKVDPESLPTKEQLG